MSLLSIWTGSWDFVTGCFRVHRSRDACGDDAESPKVQQYFEGFTDLPIELQEHVVKSCYSARDQFNMSLIDIRCHYLIRRCRIRPETITLKVIDDEPQILMTFEHQKHKKCTWVVKSTRKIGGKEREQGKKEIIEGIQFIFWNDFHNMNTISCFTLEPMNSVKVLMDYLTKLFPRNQQYEEVVLNTDVMKKTPEEFLKQLPTKKTKTLSIKGKDMKTDQIVVLTKGFQCDFFLHLEDGFSGDPNLLKSINVRFARFDSGSCISSYHLSNLNSEFIVALQTKFKTSDLVKLVNDWIESDNSELKGVFLFHTEVTYSRHQVIHETGAEAWKEEDREKCFLFENRLGKTISVDCSSGFDLWRDDVLATLLFAKNFFGFFVWKNRFPSRKEDGN